MSVNLNAGMGATSFRSVKLFSAGRPGFQLIGGLCSTCLGAMLASVGVGRQFGHTEPMGVSDWGFKIILLGSALSAGCLLWTLRVLQRIPDARDDCERYGRHMFGLTFLLLLIGLCNAVGTSTLAVNGGLGFSAAAILEASNPKHVTDAEAKYEAARADLTAKKKALEKATRQSTKAEQLVARSCASADTQASQPCHDARSGWLAAQDAKEEAAVLRQDAEEAVQLAQASCTVLRDKTKRALFFLLSLSTMMSLFGASFYVVNSVRSKRPLQDVELGSDQPSTRDAAAPPSSNRSNEQTDAQVTSAIAVAAGSSTAPAVAAVQTRTAPPTRRSEPFDVHAFWSGAFFRVGEGVLFTFAFFWLIWTSDKREYVIWLPVVGLFIGMFVKTGESIIFRLGMRVLSAVEALLPSVPPRGHPARDGSTAQSSARATSSEATAASTPA